MLGSQPVFGAESVRRPDLRVRLWYPRLPMHVGTVVGDLDGEALEEDRSDGNRRKAH